MKEIPFEGLIEGAYRQSADHGKRAKGLISGLQGTEQPDEELLLALDAVRSEAELALSVGTMVEFLSREAVLLNEFDTEQEKKGMNLLGSKKGEGKLDWRKSNRLLFWKQKGREWTFPICWRRVMQFSK